MLFLLFWAFILSFLRHSWRIIQNLLKDVSREMFHIIYFLYWIDYTLFWHSFHSSEYLNGQTRKLVKIAQLSPIYRSSSSSSNNSILNLLFNQSIIDCLFFLCLSDFSRLFVEFSQRKRGWLTTYRFWSRWAGISF